MSFLESEVPLYGCKWTALSGSLWAGLSGGGVVVVQVRGECLKFFSGEDSSEWDAWGESG